MKRKRMSQAAAAEFLALRLATWSKYGATDYEAEANRDGLTLDAWIRRTIRRLMAGRSLMRATRNLVEVGRIVRTPGTCGGAYRLAGTRVPVATLKARHRGGDGPRALAHDFELEMADVRAALAFRRRA